MMIRMANKNIEKIRLNATSHSVRASQAVLQYGVGAMVDFPSQTLMTAAPEYWNDQIIRIHDERLEKSLGVRYFELPAVGKTGTESHMPGSPNGISARNAVASSPFRNGLPSLIKMRRNRKKQTTET